MTAPKLPEGLEPVAWLDDGLSASNGTEDSSFRVVTDKTKRGMPHSAVVAYTTPLVRLSHAQAALQALAADLAEWRKLLDPSLLHANLVRGVPAKLTREHLIHLLGTDPEIAALKEDAARYRLLRRGQQWSVINGIGDTLRADELDAAIDSALALAAKEAK